MKRCDCTTCKMKDAQADMDAFLDVISGWSTLTDEERLVLNLSNPTREQQLALDGAAYAADRLRRNHD